jgi:hypothetical protein
MVRLMTWKKSGWIVALPSFFAAIAVAIQAPAANVAWVSFHGSDLASTNAAAVLGAGANAPDKNYTDLLAANGHTVTRVLTADGSAALAATLNAYDLVIIGRSINSANYELDAETAAWNNLVTKPTIDMSGYTLRSNRLGYTTGTTIPDAGGAGNPTGVVRLQVTNPAHPIFAGVTLDGTNTMVNPYNTALPSITTVNGAVSQRGISVNTNPVAGAGVVLATVNTTGDAANGGMIIAQWAAGASMGTTPADILGGPRLVFLSGTREHDGTATGIASSSEIAGFYDLSPDGEKMFLNAVRYMAAVPEPATTMLAAFAMASLGLMRRQAR